MTRDTLLKALVAAVAANPTKIVTKAFVAPGEVKDLGGEVVWGPEGTVPVVEAENVPKGKLFLGWKDRPAVKAPVDCLVVDVG